MMRGNYQSTLAMATIMVAALCMLVSLDTARAHDEGGPFASMKKGQILAVTKDSLRIDQEDFNFAGHVEITDQYRRPISLKDLERGQDVFFSLDPKNKITRIVLLIPS